MNRGHLIGPIAALVGLGVHCAYAEPFHLEHLVGLAIVDHKGAVCLAIDNKRLEASSSQALVRADTEPILHAATVSKMLAAPCQMALKANIAGDYYELQISQSEKLKPGPYFAVLCLRSQFVIKNREVLATLQGLPDRMSFRFCTSNEGLHFTLWQGRPITGKRLWHRYFYLGYDVEFSCHPEEPN